MTLRELAKQQGKSKVAIAARVDGSLRDLAAEVPAEDLERSEEKMGEIVRADHPFVREEVPREEALAMFAGEPYKEELLADIPDPVVSLYRMGNFLDLCRGPHLPSSGRGGVYKLLNTAGAYWGGGVPDPGRTP